MEQISPYILLTSRIVHLQEGQRISGTNINFLALATRDETPGPMPPPSGVYVAANATNIKVRIGGETVYEGLPSNWQVNVRFASTHFQDGSQIKVRIDTDFMLSKSDDPLAFIYPYSLCHEVELDVYNKGSNVADNEWPPLAASIAPDALQGMNHTIWSIYNGTWTVIDLHNALFDATAFNLAAHGTEDGAEDNFSSLFGEQEVMNCRAASEAAGVPRINVALIHSCRVGQNALWFGGLLSALGTTVTDQAAVGFTVDFSIAGFVPFAGNFWDRLEGVDSIPSTVEEAAESGRVEYNKLFSAMRNPPFPLLHLHQNLIVFGDPYTTLNRVYTGNTTPAPQMWCKITP